MIRYHLDWETEDGASGNEIYCDDTDALADLEELIADPEITFAGLTEVETHGGMVWNITTIREYEKGA